MKLIVGLGNPGKIYIDSRHNVGFSTVKSLGRACKVSFKKDNNAFCLSARCKIKNQNIVLAMPLTFMNLSGLAVRALIKKYKLDLDNLLVVCDDLDLVFGRIKIRSYGSSGGHQGIRSITDCLKSKRFSRLRIGIGRPRAKMEISDYVLSRFSRKDKQQLKDIAEKAKECCRTWVVEGIAESMNIYNQRS